MSYLFYPVVLALLAYGNHNAFNAENCFFPAVILTLMEAAAMFGSWMLVIYFKGIWPVFVCNLSVAILSAIIGVAKRNEAHWRKTGWFGAVMMICWMIFSSFLFIVIKI